jgi:hypothetical protein
MAVLRLLARVTAIPGEACLAMNAEKLTESVIITLTEYWSACAGKTYNTSRLEFCPAGFSVFYLEE